ncbi:MAG: hypothetical protein NT065_04140 [Chlamydiae bacterium]|nr:hypothetical protein [Chlamydiota bacterium]
MSMQPTSQRQQPHPITFQIQQSISCAARVITFVAGKAFEALAFVFSKAIDFLSFVGRRWTNPETDNLTPAIVNRGSLNFDLEQHILLLKVLPSGPLHKQPGRADHIGTPHHSFFDGIDSSKLVKIDSDVNIENRKDFLDNSYRSDPPIIGKSSFIPDAMLEHLMRNKKDTALAVKQSEWTQDAITNMEGALHTFITPVCSVLMTGDYKWVGQLIGEGFRNNQARNVLMSAAVQPDFEFDTVMMKVVEVGDSPIVGKDLGNFPVADISLKQWGSDSLLSYEEALRKHMVYHLSPSHALPALDQIDPTNILSQTDVKTLLETAITEQVTTSEFLKDKFMRIEHSLYLTGDRVVSLEMLYATYLQQLRNEFRVLNQYAPQGYVYTIDPPAIFVRCLEGGAPGGDPAHILNRLQALAFKDLKREELFTNMQVIAFNDFRDRSLLPLLGQVFPKKIVVSKSSLFQQNPKGTYFGHPNLALVIHNNSDGFGQNIEFEGPSSLDGVIGSFSNAACTLKRDREDLFDHVMTA